MASCKEKLIGKFRDRSAVIGIFGLGYVGLPLALRYAETGFRVLGFDIDPQKVDTLNQGGTYIERITPSQITAAREQGFVATINFTQAAEADALIICVPTPLGKHRDPDLSFVTDTADSIVPHLRRGQVVSLESTTYPGTTEEELLPRIESTGLGVGDEVFLVYSPEREDPGNPDFKTRTIPKVCGGHTAACLEVGQALYGAAIDEVVPVSSTKVAEMSKLLENIYRAVNIGLVNEMKIVADRMGIDIHEVIRAAATKPFGFTPFYPGPGLGGHCIPVDPFYLTWKAEEFNVRTRFIELAGEVNTYMPRWVVVKVLEALNDRGKAVKGSKILVVGIAYKKNVDDLRESPAIEIIHRLRQLGANVAYTDPHVPVMPRTRKSRIKLQSEPLSASSLRQKDAVLIVTAHDSIDYHLIKREAQLVLDGRGVFSGSEIDNVLQV